MRYRRAQCGHYLAHSAAEGLGDRKQEAQAAGDVGILGGLPQPVEALGRVGRAGLAVDQGVAQGGEHLRGLRVGQAGGQQGVERRRRADDRTGQRGQAGPGSARRRP